MHQANCFNEIAVVAYERSRFVMSRPRIIQQMHCKIHIGPLLFQLPNANAIIGRSTNGLSQHLMAREMPLNNFQFLYVRVESPEVDMLSTLDAAVIGDSANVRGEILDTDDVVFTAQHALTHRPRIKPTIWSALQCTVVKVESINVDCCTLCDAWLLQTKQRAAKSPWKPSRRDDETTRVVGQLCDKERRIASVLVAQVLSNET